MAFGGEYNNKNSARSNSDVRKYDLLRSFYYRVGYEYFKKVSPKFTMFYGADFRPSVSYNKTENFSQTSGYFVGTITDSKVLGVAPFLGAKFQLTSRLSLSTEAGISINYSEIKTRNYYVPISSAFPDKMEDSHKNTYNWFSTFNNPVFLIFAFDF